MHIRLTHKETNRRRLERLLALLDDETILHLRALILEVDWQYVDAVEAYKDDDDEPETLLCDEKEMRRLVDVLCLTVGSARNLIVLRLLFQPSMNKFHWPAVRAMIRIADRLPVGSLRSVHVKGMS